MNTELSPFEDDHTNDVSQFVDMETDWLVPPPKKPTEKKPKRGDTTHVTKKFLSLWNGPDLMTEFKFATGIRIINYRNGTRAFRRWRLDYVPVGTRIAIEIHGGVFVGGRHTRGKGFTEDRHKMNQAILAGWQVFEITSPMLRKEVIDEIAAYASSAYDKALHNEQLEKKRLWTELVECGKM